MSDSWKRQRKYIHRKRRFSAITMNPETAATSMNSISEDSSADSLDDDEYSGVSDTNIHTTSLPSWDDYQSHNLYNNDGSVDLEMDPYHETVISNSTSTDSERDSSMSDGDEDGHLDLYLPLYQGCGVSVKDYVVSILRFIRQHHLPIVVLNDFLQFINDILPHQHNAPKNRYHFDKLMSMLMKTLVVKQKTHFAETVIPKIQMANYSALLVPCLILTNSSNSMSKRRWKIY